MFLVTPDTPDEEIFCLGSMLNDLALVATLVCVVSLAISLRLQDEFHI